MRLNFAIRAAGTLAASLLVGLGLTVVSPSRAQARGDVPVGLHSISVTPQFDCAPPTASLFLDVLFQYQRDEFDQFANLGWTVYVFEQDGDDKDLLVAKSGGFPNPGDGSQEPNNESGRAEFFLDLCALIASDGDGNECAELRVVVEVTGGNPDSPHLSSTLPFSLCCPGCVPALAVEMGEMSAEWTAPAFAAIRWSTLSETETVGFRVAVARRAKGPYTYINGGAIVPSTGSTTSGADYLVLHDNSRPRSAAWYRIEDIDMHGVVTKHDPIRMSTPGKPVSSTTNTKKTPSGH